ncbi:hypothetical protein J5226_17700 [Lysobacter sp. K5869]|uniref:hypothetical protein n=1 Tax=Lysobacter sp. K5869 TaxID=2820808 RepID=UPI001C060FDB|nr:hypothetical protein [Lysobacter sp. K5869]QWP75437.1 hypothetical protein J5226_17700 [Lysobacter sp. K5869]
MSGAAWAPGLWCAALGLLLGLLPPRVGRGGALAFAATWCVVAGLGTITPPTWASHATAACWIGVAATVAALYWRGAGRERVALGLAFAAGLSVASASFAATSAAPPAGAPLCLALALPSRWLAARGGGIAIQVAGSWLAAVALLALVLSYVPVVPGDRPDHLE